MPGREVIAIAPPASMRFDREIEVFAVDEALGFPLQSALDGLDRGRHVAAFDLPLTRTRGGLEQRVQRLLVDERVRDGETNPHGFTEPRGR